MMILHQQGQNESLKKGQYHLLVRWRSDVIKKVQNSLKEAAESKSSHAAGEEAKTSEEAA